jgi:hypothetical protein
MSDKTVQFITKQYFDYTVTAYTTKNSLYWYPAFPWRFKIEHNGETREYSGMPNYCETSRAALKRAWYRAKWLSEGTYHQRYKVTSIVKKAG